MKQLAKETPHERILRHYDEMEGNGNDNWWEKGYYISMRTITDRYINNKREYERRRKNKYYSHQDLS